MVKTTNYKLLETMCKMSEAPPVFAGHLAEILHVGNMYLDDSVALGVNVDKYSLHEASE